MAFSSVKLVSLFTSVVALATIGSQVALAQQSPRQNTTPPANSQPNSQTNSRPQTIEEFLGLSQDQVKKIRDILMEREKKIEELLSKEQLSILEEAKKLGPNAAPVLQKLNLSDDQKNRIGTIVQASNQQIRSVLTPEQLQKLETQLQQDRQNRQNRPNQPNPQNQNRR